MKSTISIPLKKIRNFALERNIKSFDILCYKEQFFKLLYVADGNEIFIKRWRNCLSKCYKVIKIDDFRLNGIIFLLENV